MLIATETDVYSFSGGQPRPLLSGERVSSLVEGRRLGAAGLESGDVLLLEDGRSRRLETGVGEALECLVFLDEDGKELVAGVEGPHLYRVATSDGKAKRLESFDELDCRDRFHTPWGGPAAVRSLARSGDWLYADIHVGSIMRSPDLGRSWEPVTPQLDEDVHQVTTCPAAPRRVFANTADAVWVSEDRGDSWEHRDAGLAHRYGRAIAVDPRDPGRLLASVSRGPGSGVDGRLYRSEDAGRSWTQVADGFPASTRGNIDTFHIAFDGEGVAWAVASSTLYRSTDGGARWEVAWEAPENLESIACRS